MQACAHARKAPRTLRCPDCYAFVSAAQSMKSATWTVNGLSAGQAQCCEWLAHEDRPDVVCLQELKAELGQIPLQCQLDDYHVYWHGYRAYSGVSLHVRKDAFDTRPSFSHPDFD